MTTTMHEIGRVIEILEQKGLHEKVKVIVLSDGFDLMKLTPPKAA